MNLHREMVERCFELFEHGRIDEASALAERGVEGDPEDGRLWQLLGLLRHRRGDYPAACAALETAGLLVPLDPASRYALAECHARAGRKGLAGDLYRQLGRDQRCPTTLLPAVAAGLGSLGQNEAALAACRKIARRDPEHHHAHFGIAFYLRRLGRPVQAIFTAVSRAYELAPQVVLYRVTLAVLLDHTGRRDEACDLLRDLDPGAVHCRSCLQRAMAIFQEAGDWHSFEAFRARTDEVPEPRREDA
jgi:Flp pilus assembly protein TadD